MSAISIEETETIQQAQARMAPPSRFGDKAFEWLTLAMAAAVVVLVIFSRHQKIRFSFPHHVYVGPGSRAIRCAAVYLRNAGFFGNCVNHCCAIGHRDGGIPYGTCSVVGSAAAHFADRDARRDPQRNSRTLGHLRDGAVAPELSFSIPETILWLDTTFHRPDLR